MNNDKNKFETKVVITFKLNHIIEIFFLINMSNNYLQIVMIKEIELYYYFNSKNCFEHFGLKIDSIAPNIARFLISLMKDHLINFQDNE